MQNYVDEDGKEEESYNKICAPKDKKNPEMEKKKSDYDYTV